MFNQVSQRVAQTSQLACDDHPSTAGETFDPDKVNVLFSAGGGAPQGSAT
jgi:hypothetical protein